MQLQIKSHTHNTYPLKAVLIKSTQVRHWILEIQRMKLDFAKLQVYPLPNIQANSIWGCLLLLSQVQKIDKIAPHEYCQLAGNYLFIPENARISPYVKESEIQTLLNNTYHILHPEFGFVELTQTVNWIDLLENPLKLNVMIHEVQDSLFIPQSVSSFRLQADDNEDMMQNLENQFRPDGSSQGLQDKPLSFFEKGKLLLYNQLFQDDKEGKDSKEAGSFLNWLGGVLGGGEDWVKGVANDYEDLEKRNQKKFDKFLDLLHKNPEEAMKYAIPLDKKGVGRGGIDMDIGSDWDFFKRWDIFLLFGQTYNSSSGGGTVGLGEQFYKLQEEYRKTAQRLIKEGKYREAAFMYLKLLKDYRQAATTLEEGRFYQEAARVYLKYLQDKLNAARCYEKGFYTEKAIDLYKELKMHEKVGDLYMLLGKPKEAYTHYEILVNEYKIRKQFIKASLVYKNKMNDLEKAQALLLEGWVNNYDSFNCLNNYFNNIAEEKDLAEEIQSIYETLRDTQKLVFLDVMKHEFKKKENLQNLIREIAYEIISSKIKEKPHVASKLLDFNSQNQGLPKDIARYGISQKFS